MCDSPGTSHPAFASGQASAFLHLKFIAVVHNTLSEKPVLNFHMSGLHVPAGKIFQLRPGCRRWVYLCFVDSSFW